MRLSALCASAKSDIYAFRQSLFSDRRWRASIFFYNYSVRSKICFAFFRHQKSDNQSTLIVRGDSNSDNSAAVVVWFFHTATEDKEYAFGTAARTFVPKKGICIPPRFKTRLFTRLQEHFTIFGKCFHGKKSANIKNISSDRNRKIYFQLKFILQKEHQTYYSTVTDFARLRGRSTSLPSRSDVS